MYVITVHKHNYIHTYNFSYYISTKVSPPFSSPIPTVYLSFFPSIHFPLILLIMGQASHRCQKNGIADVVKLT